MDLPEFMGGSQMSMPQIPKADREQAINDMIEALALHEAAIASLINAEAAKVDALVAAGIPAAQSSEEVQNFQAAVAAVLQVAAEQQQSMSSKLEMLRGILAETRQMPNP